MSPPPLFSSNVVVERKGSVLKLTLSRPKKYNAINSEVYEDITNVLNYASSEAGITIVAITGEGKYFTAGNDLKASMELMMKGGDPAQLMDEGVSRFRRFALAFINCTKLVCVGVNGPAVGVGVTLLGLSDHVYASSTATFMTPFMKLAQSPEACSSYTFPLLMGRALANDVLLRGRTLSATEALSCGLVSEVFPVDSFQREFNARLAMLEGLAAGALLDAKALLQTELRGTLTRVNERECVLLAKRYSSEESANAILEFVTSRSKSKL